MRRRILVILGMLLTTGFMAAQKPIVFPLERHDDGHYYFQATVYGEKSEIMLESGIPALLIGRGFYERRMKNRGLEMAASTSKMRLLSQSYDILYRTDGKVNIGSAIYDGPIFILDGFDGMSLPIQYLKDPSTGKRIVTIDLDALRMSVGGTLSRQGTKYKLAFEKETGRPYINSVFTVDGFKFDGKLLVDFGNPMLMFLFRQHKSVHNAIVKGAIELQSAYNAKGEPVSMGFHADRIEMYGQVFSDQIIGVTAKYKNAKELGYLGIPFFDAPVSFDFDDCWMYKQ